MMDSIGRPPSVEFDSHKTTSQECPMPIYEVSTDRLQPLSVTTFEANGVRERGDLQRLLLNQIDVIAPDVLVLGEEFGNWEDSSRRIDLLGIDREANLVVIELKRTGDGGHMELQAIRYAAMVASMTFDQAVEVHGRHLQRAGSDADPREAILRFLEWEAPDEDRFGQDVRILLVSADFSRELTTAVLWLNERDLNICCIRMRPYTDGTRLLVDVQQVLPLPEAADYLVRVREKRQEAKAGKWQPKDWKTIWQDFDTECSPEDVKVARHLYDWFLTVVEEVVPTADAFAPIVRTGAMRYNPLKVETAGNIRIWFHFLRMKPPFNNESLRREFRDRLCRIPGASIPDERLSGIPKIPLELLRSEAGLTAFKDAVTWMLSVLEGGTPGQDVHPKKGY